MCELTVPFSGAGAQRHRALGEVPCRECKDARNAATRERRKERGSENARWNKLWHRYRIRPDDYLDLLLKQEGKCPLCLNSFKDSKEMHLDHNHACDHEDKGERSCRNCVRAILCRNCNVRLIGVEDTEWLKRALNYIGRKDG